VEKSQIIDVVYPIRKNQTDPADASYTGKIRATDTIYSLDGSSFRGERDIGEPPRSGTGSAQGVLVERLCFAAIQLHTGRSVYD
jgi:pectate lyase